MAETKEPKLVSAATKKNPRVTAKICEHMPYSGREAFKRLRSNVMIALKQKQNKENWVIGITSPQPSEGKSTVSINLAYSLAGIGKKVLLIDADMRRPSINTLLGESLTPGLSEVLMGTDNLKDVIKRYASTADSTSFDVILSGSIPDNPSELLDSTRFQKLIEVVSGAYDCVIIDLPPVNAVVDAVNVSKCTDGLIVVMREGHCLRGVLRSCVEQLQYAEANILGFVMNGCVAGAGKKYQYGQQYAYRYGK